MQAILTMDAAAVSRMNTARTDQTMELLGYRTAQKNADAVPASPDFATSLRAKPTAAAGRLDANLRVGVAPVTKESVF